jgi:isoleucyl-tRNA synthetase
VQDYDFNSYTRALSDFCNEDLSAFYFDIRKDRLYCDAPGDPARRAYRTVLDTLFHALIRYAAPVLVFTSEEVWGSRYPGAGSVHVLEWPLVDASWMNAQLIDDWAKMLALRSLVTRAVEPMRREKEIGSSLEADVVIQHGPGFALASRPLNEFASWPAFLLSKFRWEMKSLILSLGIQPTSNARPTTNVAAAGASCPKSPRTVPCVTAARTSWRSWMRCCDGTL